MRQARTSINWIGSLLPRGRQEGYGESALPLNALLLPEHRPFGLRPGLPLMVYFYSLKDDEKIVAFEAGAFTDERVGFCSRYFNCIRISQDDIPSASERRQYGDGEPLVILMDSQGQEVRRHQGWSLTGARLHRSLAGLYRSHYHQSLDPFLEKEGRMLDALDEIHWDLEELKLDLQQAQEHLAAHDCQRGRRLVKEISQEIEELEAKREEALTQERKLLEESGKPREEPPR